MRQEELLGLQWRAVDFTEGRLQVDRTLQRVYSEWILSEPKTERSRRSIRLSELASSALKRHRAAQLETRLQLGEAWEGEVWDLVFCSPYGLPLHGRTITRRPFRKLLESAGLPSIRFHDLRHTAATRRPHGCSREGCT